MSATSSPAVSPAAVATWTLREPVSKDWTGEVITLPLPATAALSEGGTAWVLRDQTGRQWPAQVERTADCAQVHTCVDLAADASLTLTLVAAPATTGTLALTTAADGSVEVSNGVIAVRVAPGGRYPAGPVPAPVTSVRVAGGAWLGQGQVTGCKYLSERHVEWLAQGPVFARWRVRLAVGGKTASTTTCTLYRGADFVWISDESSRDFDLVWEHGFTAEQAPDTLWTHGGGEHATRRRELRYSNDAKVFHVDFNSGWHQMSYSWFGLARSGQPCLLGVSELRGGSWQLVGRNRITLHQSQARTLTVRAPLCGGTREWSLLAAPPPTPAEAAPPAPGTYPAWSVSRAHQKWSELPLRKLLSWQLQYQAPPAAGTLRLFGQERLAGLRAYWAQHPEITAVFHRRAAEARAAEARHRGSHEANVLVADALLTGSEEDFALARQLAVGDLRRSFLRARDGGYHTLIIFDGRALKLNLQTLDLLDALGRLDEATRSEAARYLLFLAYCFADRDYFPFELNMMERGDERSWAPDLWNEIGDALCPPNFMTEYYTSFGMVGCFYPAHPQAAAWRADATALMLRQFERHYFDGGAYIESLNYHHHNQIMTLQFALSLRTQGGLDFLQQPRFHDQFGFWVDLLTPAVARNEHGMGMLTPSTAVDAGAARLRTTGSCGNTGHDCSDYFVPAELAVAAALYHEREPAYAQRLIRAWREGGRLVINHHSISAFLLLADPGIADAPSLELESTLLHGLGATLHGAHGDPDEVCALVKCGWATHHNDQDEGGFELWAYGAPVSSDQGYHFTDTDGKRYGGDASRLHNCVVFDQKSSCYAGMETSFPPERHVVTELADLLVMNLSTDCFNDTPARPYTDMVPAQHVEYHRFLLFVKPHYFVIYDHIAVNPYAAQFYLHSQADQVDIAGDTVTLRGRFGVDLQARFLLDPLPKLSVGQFGVQKHVVARQNGPQDFWTWLAPVKPGISFATRRVAPNVLEVSGPGYVDTIFMAPTPLHTAHAGLAFAGRVGVARASGVTGARHQLALLDGTRLEAQ